MIAGNHDLVLTRRLPAVYEATHDLNGSIERIRAALSEQSFLLLSELPISHRTEDVQIAHAAISHEVGHVDDDHAASSQLALADRRFLALGHAHRAFCYLDDGRWFVNPRGLIELTPTALACPGSARTFASHRGTVCVLDTTADTCVWLEIDPAR